LNLKGERVFLRAIEPEDLDTLYLWENNPENWFISNTFAPFSKHLLEQYVNSVQDLFLARQIRLMLCLNQTLSPIGSVDIFDYEPFSQRAGLGIVIAEESQRQKGLASEALDLVINYCFDVLLLHQVYCNVSAENEQSLNLFLNKGFQVVGIKKDWNRSKDGFQDEYLLQLINYRDL
jgi:diamine N-acetyltransferase